MVNQEMLYLFLNRKLFTAQPEIWALDQSLCSPDEENFKVEWLNSVS